MDPDQTLADLMHTAGDHLLRLAYQLTHDRASAEDVVQEALMQVCRSWRRRAPDVAHAEAYVRRAVVNEYLRRRRLRASSEVVTDRVPETSIGGGDDAVVDRDEMWRALAVLPARQRAVLVLRYYEALPDGEIAALIGAKEATVRSLAARALAGLRSGEGGLTAVPAVDGSTT
jgi:RNA polymerase sigma-70 factor (sigma-E family)